MSFRNLMVVLVVALGLVFAGCKGEEGKKEEAKKTEKKAEEGKKPADEAKKVEPAKEEGKTAEPKAEEGKVEPKADEPKDEPKAEEPKDEPKAEAPAGDLDAKGTVEAVFKALQAKDLVSVVNLMPAKYMTDIDGIVQEFGKTMDKEMWDKSIAVMDKVVKVGVAQKAGLAEMIAGMGIPAKKEDLEKAVDAIAEIWALLKETGITDLEKLKTFSTSEFAKAALPKITEKIWAFADGTQKAQVQAAMAVLTTAQVKVLETTKNEKFGEVVEVEINIAGEAEKGKMVKVDGKWIPQEMAEEWDEAMAEAKKGLLEMAAELPKSKAEAMAGLAQVETALDQVEKTGDLTSLQALGGMMMGMPGPGAPLSVDDAAVKTEVVKEEVAPTATDAPAPVKKEEVAPAATDAPAPAKTEEAK